MSSLVSRGGNRDWESCRAEKRWRREVDPQGRPSESPVLRQPLQTLPNTFPQLCAQDSGAPHALWAHQPLPFAPWPWQPAQVPVEVSPRQQGVAGRMELGCEGGVGSGFVRQPGVGAGAPAAMRYPPRECGPAAPPSESQRLANRLLCSWLATHPPTVKRLAPGSQAACDGHTLLCLRNTSCQGV